MTNSDDSSNPLSSRRVWQKRIGFVVGLALLIGALVMVWLQRERVNDALDAIQSPNLTMIALLLGAIVINIALSALTFSILIAPCGRVGIIEMQALIAATSLVNYLPLRPGLFGRIAYHKAANGIAVRDSTKMIIQAVALSVIIAGYLAAIAWMVMIFDFALWIAIALPMPLLVLGSLIPNTNWRGGRFCAAGGVRYIEVLIWAVRYYAAFHLIGVPIDFTAALAMACAAIIATMVPFISNGLGLREWAIGLLAPLITPAALGVGVTAELINRAAEIIIIVPLGLLGTSYLARRKREAGSRV